MSLADFFRKGFKSLRSEYLDMNYKEKDLSFRKSSMMLHRRQTRDTLLNKNRKINLGMSPFQTPEPSKAIVVKKDIVVANNDKGKERFKALKQWKERKNKQKEEERKKAKPVFKVSHTDNKVGLPNLDNIYKQIKGKPVPVKSFAPINHVFVAPRSVYPLSLNRPTNSRDVTKDKISVKSKSIVKPSQNILKKASPIKPKVNTSRVNSGITAKKTFGTEISNKFKASKSTLNSKPNKIIDCPVSKAIFGSSVKPARDISKWNKTSVQRSDSVTSNNKRIFGPISGTNKSKLLSKVNSHTSTQTNSSLKSSGSFIANKSISKPELKLKSSGSFIANKPKSKPADRFHKVQSNDIRKKVTFDSTSVKSSLLKNKPNTCNNLSKTSVNQEKVTVKYQSIPKKEKVNLKSNIKEGSNLNETPTLTSNNSNNNHSETSKLNNSIFYEDDEIVIKTPVRKNRASSRSIGSIQRKTPKKFSPIFNNEEAMPNDNEEVKINETEEQNKSLSLEEIEEKIFANGFNIDKDELNNESCILIEDDSFSTNKRISFDEVASSKSLIFYEDNEMVIKTPIRSRKSRSLIRKSVNRISGPVTRRSESLRTPKKECLICLSCPTSTRKSKHQNDNKFEITPKPKTPIDVLSPFVTVSRGKVSAKKEHQRRKSMVSAETTSEMTSCPDNDSDQAGAAYFEKLLNDEIVRLETLCDKWNKYKLVNDIDDDGKDLIDVAVGQSKLLISKKFQQFRGLIDQYKYSEFKEKPVTCEDLHGFWDMMYQQVINLDKRFGNLDKLASNNWQEVVVVQKKAPQTRPRGRAKKNAVKSSLTDFIKAARNKKKDEKDILMTPESHGTSSAKKRISSVKASRLSLLQTKPSRRTSSPGLAMMKVTQAIKAGDGLTPRNSILKTDLTKSLKKSTKTVLFADKLQEYKSGDMENKENAQSLANLNDISELPNTLGSIRRSRRLSKLN